MTVVRVIVYRGSEEWVESTLGHSKPDGTQYLGRGDSITVRTVPSVMNLFRTIRFLWSLFTK